MTGAAAAARTRVLRAIADRRAVVLGYHGVGPIDLVDDVHGMRLPVDVLRAQVGVLREAGFELVTMRELHERTAAAGGRPPRGTAALTFDDGMQDNHELLLPLLRELGVPATVYVATGLVGGPNPYVAGARLMTADELRDVHAAGVELGAHTVTHADLAVLDEDRCYSELVHSRAWLEDLTGAPVTTFAYPFGRVGPAAVAAVRRAGFATAVTVDPRGPWDPLRLPRQMVHPFMGLGGFVTALAGLYEPLRASPPVRVARTATRGARRLVRARRAGLPA